MFPISNLRRRRNQVDRKGAFIVRYCEINWKESQFYCRGVAPIQQELDVF